jgi:hypothetical protein
LHLIAEEGLNSLRNQAVSVKWEVKPALDGQTCGQLTSQEQAGDRANISGLHAFMKEVMKNVSEVIVSSSYNMPDKSVSFSPKHTAAKFSLSFLFLSRWIVPRSSIRAIASLPLSFHTMPSM